MGYSSFIGKRYTKAKKKWSFSAITAIAIGGVALGVAALSTVVSITSAFEDEFVKKILGVNAHVLVMKYGLDFTEYRDVIETLRELPEIEGAAPFVIQEMMITKDEHASSVLLKGVDPDLLPTVMDLPRHIVEGSTDGLRLAGSRPPKAASRTRGSIREKIAEVFAEPDAGAEQADAGLTQEKTETTDKEPGKDLPGIILGRTLSENLDAQVGDVVNVATPFIGLDVMGWTPTGDSIPTRQFKVIGIFYAGFLEYDTKLVYVDLFQAQHFFDQGDSVTGVEVTVKDIENATEVADKVKEMLGRGPYHTIDWKILNEHLFTALKTQKVVLIVILSVVVAIAAFNIIATLGMMVFDKRREIAILKSMGASHGGILRIFVYAGAMVGLVGIGIGLAVSLVVCTILEKVQWPLDPKVYLIDHLPVRINLLDFAITAVVAFAICLCATILPSLTASRLKPVDGLKRD